MSKTPAPGLQAELLEMALRFNAVVKQFGVRITQMRADLNAVQERRAGRGDPELGRERLREAQYRRRIQDERHVGLAYVHRIAREVRQDLGLKETP